MGPDDRSPREQIRASLIALKDVYGIAGSFVFARGGYLVARELPPMFDDLTLAEAGMRLALLQETFAAVGDKLDSAVLRFADHKIYVKPLSAGALCIITVGGVNMPVLRMAANLVARRIGPVLEPIADDEPTPAETTSPDLVVPPRSTRRFRDPGAD
jgi:predicted regulator of Ras-like GTPase activity (Roadblock/LC7/MglB family)